MAITRKEREHFDAIARAKLAEKREDLQEAAASTAAERVRQGFLLGAIPRTQAIEAAMDAVAVGQIGLARRRPKPRG